MDNQETTSAFDLGLVVSDADKSLAFYRDVLGLVYGSGIPINDGAMFHQLVSGSSTLKIIAPATAPAICSAPGRGQSGLDPESTMRAIMQGAGFRFLTIYTSDIQEIAARCAAAGHSMVVPLQEQSYAPGTFLAIVEDPDGNWVELLSSSKTAFDLGLVVVDGETSIAFYRDMLGFTYDSGVPIYDGAMYHKLASGSSTLKIIAPATAPEICSAPGRGQSGLELDDAVRAIMRGAGFRSLTINVSNIEEIADRCVKAGCAMIVPLQELSYAPGSFMAMVEDPDGNWVELLQKTA
jgi:catechol 2,3-dioxygenase-like lactoylglutathione lyase family enzyme